MIPTHNPLIGILLILYGVDVFPCILGKSDMGASFFRILALNACRDFNTLIAILSDEHAADLRLTARTRMLPDLAHNFTVDH